MRGDGGVLNGWLLWLDETPRPGHLNMAIDQGLLDLAGRDQLAVLRIYRWSPHCLSFGRNEPAARRYDRALIARRGIDVVRRPTGGRAVWHARELTYAVAAPAERFGTLAEAYTTIHLVLANAVSHLGGTPALAPRAPATPLDGGGCFASPAGGEVMLSGRKIVGSAQLREGTALLQHGSLLLDDDQQLVADLSLGRTAPGRDAPLNSLLPTPASFEAAGRALADAAQSAWPGEWWPVSDPSELLAAALPHMSRFSSDDWTWRR